MVACAASQVCATGACLDTCAAGQTGSGGGCPDLSLDAFPAAAQLPLVAVVVQDAAPPDEAAVPQGGHRETGATARRKAAHVRV
jgi:hypothetical protein